MRKSYFILFLLFSCLFSLSQPIVWNGEKNKISIGKSILILSEKADYTVLDSLLGKDIKKYFEPSLGAILQFWFTNKN